MLVGRRVSAHDVAAYILHKQGPMTVWKLHKLLYYSQAWHLAWEDEPLFGERIEAWANGPVVPDLYPLHKGLLTVSEWPPSKRDRQEHFGGRVRRLRSYVFGRLAARIGRLA